MREKTKQANRSRGKFKPETRNLSNDEVKEILLQKISFVYNLYLLEQMLYMLKNL